MVCETYFSGDTIIHRWDPRTRLVAAVAFAALVAASDRFAALGVALGAAAAATAAARLPGLPLAKRLAALNLFVAMLWLLLPIATPGPAALELGPLAWSEDGLARAAQITLKSNAIILAFSALVSTIETVQLAHALRHLRVPAKLVHLLLMTVRYVDLLHHEYQRLRQAMKVRCFRPRMTRHTYRSLGYLVGMLLVGSFDRAQRVLAAMKCRGFRGEFYAFDHFAARGRDAALAAAALAVLAGVSIAEWI